MQVLLFFINLLTHSCHLNLKSIGLDIDTFSLLETYFRAYYGDISEITIMRKLCVLSEN
jgi:hypothetical protein